MKEEFVAVEVNGGRRPFYKHVSWGAIVAGLVVALVSQILLTLLGVAIGAATIQPMQESNPAEGMGTGAAIWWFVTGLVSLFIGAFVAGRTLGFARKKDGAVHGFLMWSTATIMSFMVAGTMLGGIVASGFSAISEPGNRQELKEQLDEVNPMKGDHDGGYQTNANRETRSNDQAQNDRVGPAKPYSGPQRTESTTGAAGSTDRVDNSGNTNLLNDNNSRTGVATGDPATGDGPPVIETSQEAQARESAEAAASATSKAALIGLGVLLIGALTCAWAGSKGVHDEVGHPRESDTRVTGGHVVPGEPING